MFPSVQAGSAGEVEGAHEAESSAAAAAKGGASNSSQVGDKDDGSKVSRSVSCRLMLCTGASS